MVRASTRVKKATQGPLVEKAAVVKAAPKKARAAPKKKETKPKVAKKSPAGPKKPRAPKKTPAEKKPKAPRKPRAKTTKKAKKEEQTSDEGNAPAPAPEKVVVPAAEKIEAAPAAVDTKPAEAAAVAN